MRFGNLASFLAVLAVANAAVLPRQISCVVKAVSDANTTTCPDFCAGTLKNESLIHMYPCGDSRFGPKHLPDTAPLAAILETYNPFYGNVCPGQFLQDWWNDTAQYWNYPPQNGYGLDKNGMAILGTITFTVGTLLDRFGSEYGSFVSPADAPYKQRALPPTNLNAAAGSQYPYNYYVYKVLKSFDAVSGPIAPWFGQPGEGVQYQLASNILTLVNGGFLARVPIDDRRYQ